MPLGSGPLASLSVDRDSLGPDCSRCPYCQSVRLRLGPPTPVTSRSVSVSDRCGLTETVSDRTVRGRNCFRCFWRCAGSLRPFAYPRLSHRPVAPRSDRNRRESPVGQCLRSLPTGLGKRPVSVCAGFGRDVFPAPVGPSPTTAVRRCRSAGRSSAGRFCVLSLSRFTDSRSDRCPYCQSARLRRDSAVRQDGSVSCQSVSEVGSGQFVHLRPLRFGVAVRQWHISLPASLRLGRGAAIRQDSACCLSPTAETATTVRWFSDRSPDWQGPTWNLRCRADCHRRATPES